MPAANRNDVLVTSLSYRPTSLDFLTRPNPVEPNALGDQHGWNSNAQRTEVSASGGQGGFGRILHAASHIEDIPLPGPSELRTSVEQISRRRKAENDISLDLPKLPERRSNKRPRPRLPPTISGLYQPPPDAGLLPRINIEAPLHAQKAREEPSTRAVENAIDASDERAPTSEPIAQVVSDVSAWSSSRPQKRNKWSDEETAHLLEGVAKFGIGNWTKILRCPDFSFNRRTALDLKDRFRVTCPEQYQPLSGLASRQTSVRNSSQVARTQKEAASVQEQHDSSRNVQAPLSSDKLDGFDTGAPLERRQRRSRHGYSKAEDEALLKGFHKYQTKWKKIRDDPELGLSSRQPTDLRDRMRNRYPDQYTKAGKGLHIRESDASKRPKDPTTISLENDRDKCSTLQRAHKSAVRPLDLKDLPSTSRPPPTKVAKPGLLPCKVTAQQTNDQFPSSDVFFGAMFDLNDEGEDELVTLDRGILSFANLDAVDKHHAMAPEPHRPNVGVIDPQDILLGFPRPSHGPPLVSTTMPSSASATALPSFSTLVPALGHESDPGFDQHVELPSLMQYYATES